MPSFFRKSIVQCFSFMFYILYKHNNNENILMYYTQCFKVILDVLEHRTNYRNVTSNEYHK